MSQYKRRKLKRRARNILTRLVMSRRRYNIKISVDPRKGVVYVDVKIVTDDDEYNCFYQSKVPIDTTWIKVIMD